ncbi:hypothetical protein HA402_006782 [Bradysia odoriphaga]|nr:hypothetical protein HA402_006782 [Bradysia odoriphaga]
MQTHKEHHHQEHQHQEHNHDRGCGCGHDHAKTQHGCSHEKTPEGATAAHDHQAAHEHGASCCSSDGPDDPDEESDRLAAAPPSVSLRFSWQVTGMDCPSCAKKIENAVTSIPGVDSARVLFATEKLVGGMPQSDVSVRIQDAVKQAGFTLLGTTPAAIGDEPKASRFAAMVLLLFMVGELLESYAANRARRGVKALMELVPEDALLIQGSRSRRGAACLADAELLNSFASFDESALTGESVPVERQQGQKVAAGSLSVDQAAQMKVTSEPGKNAIDRILQLIEEAEERRAPIERFLDRFSRYYTPAIMLLAVAVILVPPLLFAEPWEMWIYRGLTLLLIGCPCALLGQVQTIAFDKTGTLTEGKPTVTDVLPAAGPQRAATAGHRSGCRGVDHTTPWHRQSSTAQRRTGLRCYWPKAVGRWRVSGLRGRSTVKPILISAPGKLTESQLSSEWRSQVTRLETAGKTAVVVVEDGQPIGLLALRDTLRNDAKQAIAELAQLGVRGVMLTGDNPRAAAAIANELGIDYRAGLMPEDKVNAVTELSKRQPTAMIGDGINDAPAMKAASIGIAMGSGTDVALETADAALTHNRLTGVAEMIRISRATHANIRQNITIALGLKAIFLVTTLLGMTGLWLAVLADSGATALVTANALRLLKKRR